MESATSANQNEPIQAVTKDRSTVDFVYTDLDNAVEIAQGVHAVGGTACDHDQLAAHLGLEAKGGGFRLRVIGAKAFGLVTYERGGRTTLTELGRRIIDPQQEKAARVDAFLTVELYQKVFEQFKGSPLPPHAGLERALVSLGVGEKVKDKARQVLQRSAKQAGFFDLSQDRLTKPSIRTASVQQPPKVEGDDSDKQKSIGKAGGGNGGGGNFHPFVEGLLRTLPTPETNWSIAGRVKWLQAASHVFDLIYTTEDPTDQQGATFIEISKKTI